MKSTSSVEIQFVLQWLNQTVGFSHVMNDSDMSLLEVAFHFTEGSEPVKEEPLLFSFDNSTQMTISKTDRNGLVQLKTMGAKAITQIRLPERAILIANGPWKHGTFTTIDIRQFPFNPTLSLQN